MRTIRIACGSVRPRRSRSPPQLLDRAEADTISLAESSIDGTGFCNAHLGAADKRRYIGGICVAIANEALRVDRFEDGSPEYPMVGCSVAELENLLDSYASAPSTFSYTHKPCMSDIPATTQALKVTSRDGEVVGHGEHSQTFHLGPCDLIWPKLLGQP